MLIIYRFGRENTRVVCRSHCNLCQTLTAQPARDDHSFAVPATEALQEGAWKHIEVRLLSLAPSSNSSYICFLQHRHYYSQEIFLAERCLSTATHRVVLKVCMKNTPVQELTAVSSCWGLEVAICAIYEHSPGLA